MTKLLRLLAVALSTLLAGCSDDDSVADRSLNTTSTVVITTTTVRDLGAAKASRIEGLPVPASAVLSTGRECSPGSTCREEHWIVPHASTADIQAWYAARLSRTEPWRDWQACFAHAAARGEYDPLVHNWYKHEPDRLLLIRFSEEDSSVVILTERGEMPCQ